MITVFGECIPIFNEARLNQDNVHVPHILVTNVDGKLVKHTNKYVSIQNFLK